MLHYLGLNSFAPIDQSFRKLFGLCGKAQLKIDSESPQSQFHPESDQPGVVCHLRFPTARSAQAAACQGDRGQVDNSGATRWRTELR